MAAGSSSSSLTSPLTEEEITSMVKWSGKEYTVSGYDFVGELKRRICQLTTVLPKRQKLLCPKIGSKPADDSTPISTLPLNSSLERGTVEDSIIVDQVDAPVIVDDFEIGQGEVIDIDENEVNKQKLCKEINKHKLSKEINKHKLSKEINKHKLSKEINKQKLSNEINKQKLRSRVDQYKIELKNPCRKGKKLLVLDIDYTLYDHQSTAVRPYLHEFLTAAYAEYDIIIWSATSMKRIERKMEELGVLNNPNYMITALLDQLARITVRSDSKGVFDCKPLGLIWAHFPEFYSSKNTIMFDDLQRNFVMNTQNGLTIRPFRKAHANCDSDWELVKLAQYLLAIAELDDISILDHNKWESFDESNVQRRH